jgi:hypothetical protein
MVLVSDMWCISMLLHCHLTYTNPVSGGSICPGGGRYSIRIEFWCSSVFSVPVFVEETADCVHHFSWTTPVSCPSLVIERWTDFIEFKLVCICVDWLACKVTCVTLTAFNCCKIEYNLNFIEGFSSYHTVNTLHHSYKKTRHLMLCMEIFVVFSEICTEWTLWVEGNLWMPNMLYLE